MVYAPFIPTGFTDFCYFMSPQFRQFPHTTLCAKLEMKLADCVEAYGTNRVREKCADLMYDMFECKTGTFQKQRAHAIRKERMRQYRAGKLDKPFDEYPPLDSFLYV